MATPTLLRPCLCLQTVLAALAKPGPGSANVLISRRALRDNPIDAATDAVKGLAAAGADAAARAATAILELVRT